MAETDVNSPAFPGISYLEQEEALTICRDVFGGTLRMREEGQKYLPMFSREEADDYKDRLSTAVLYNAFRRTVTGLVGMVFRKELIIGDDTPDDTREQLKDVDQEGRGINTFARDVFENAWVDGHSFIFVDYPLTGDEYATLADERAAGLRPYWTNILKQDLLNWRTSRRNGVLVLEQISFREPTVEEDGTFGEREVERMRVFRLEDVLVSEDSEKLQTRVKWEIWRKQKGEDGKSDKWVVEDEGYMSPNMDEIPLVPVYVNYIDALESEPPLIDLALENIKHYQVRSDHDNVLHVASVPIPVLKGVERDESGKIAVGPHHAIILEDENGDASYLEPEGVALEAGRQHLQDIEKRMAALGLQQLEQQTRAAETAEGKRIDQSVTQSTLATAAWGLEAALSKALELNAKWLGSENAGSLSVNRDFETLMLDSQMISVLSGLVADSQLSLDTLWLILEEGEVLPSSFDAEIERERIETGDLAVLARLIPQMAGREEGQE